MAPAVGVCSACGREFMVPVTALKRVADAQQSLSSQFAAHDCAQVTTQNSQQDVFVAFMDHTILFASFTGSAAGESEQPV